MSRQPIHLQEKDPFGPDSLGRFYEGIEGHTEEEKSKAKLLLIKQAIASMRRGVRDFASGMPFLFWIPPFIFFRKSTIENARSNLIEEGEKIQNLIDTWKEDLPSSDLKSISQEMAEFKSQYK